MFEACEFAMTILPRLLSVKDAPISPDYEPKERYFIYFL